MNNLFVILFYIYIIGFILEAINVIIFARQFNSLKLKSETFRLNNPNLPNNLFFRPLNWPFNIFSSEPYTGFIFSLTGIDVFSAVHNKIKNLIIDFFKGKNRYTQCCAHRELIQLPTGHNPLQELGIDINFKFVNILYGKHKEQYLLGIHYVNDAIEGEFTEISRFDLDNCERLSQDQFIEKLSQINANLAQQTLKKIAE